jgi:nucleoside-diphosphate-sugar epimerase
MKALITGGTGFLGGALARRLLSEGALVTVLGRNSTRGQQLSEAGIRFIRADLADARSVQGACAGQEVVFHCGANVAPWGRTADFYNANVLGTQHIVWGCQAHNVTRLVHVSTPSIYFSHSDRINVAEDDRLPRKAVNAYAATKRTAESIVDRAFRDGLPVVTIRPRAIFGPGDTTIFPRLLAALQKDRLRIIGNGKNIQDLTYIDNVVQALLDCADASALVLGRKYNITNSEPVRIWEKLANVCNQLGYAFPQRHVPYTVAFALAWFVEWTYRLLRRRDQPPLTCYAVSLLAKNMTLDISAAQRDLGYRPRVSIDEGVDRCVHWWRVNSQRTT